MLVRFFQNIGQYTEPATVSHADHKFADSKVCAMLNYSIQCRNQCLSTFERKPFLTDKFFMNKTLESNSQFQVIIKMFLLFRSKNF